MQFHPLADKFPLLEGQAQRDLVEDIRENGLLEPIWIYEGKILDGRNRWLACQELGIVPFTRHYRGDSPASFVLSMNLRRRHLTPGDALMVVVRFKEPLQAEARQRSRLAGLWGAAMTNGRIPADFAEAGGACPNPACDGRVPGRWHEEMIIAEADPDHEYGMTIEDAWICDTCATDWERFVNDTSDTARGKANWPYPGMQWRDDAARIMGVSPRTIERADTVVQDGAPELIAAVQSGEVAVSTAAELTALSMPEQAELVARGREAILAAAKRIREDDAARKRETFRVLKAELLPLPEGQYRCLVIDPPWPVAHIDRAVRPAQVDFDYPMMSEEELFALDVTALAAPDAHLYLWTTHRHLPLALRLAEHWGFRYECLLTWVKNVGFTPYSWMRSTEHVLFCRRGHLDLTVLGRRLDFSAKVREHSRKPDEFFDLVQEVSPGPRLELFARQRREGFEAWGNEVDRFDAAVDDAALAI